jgi:hypothetical protein
MDRTNYSVERVLQLVRASFNEQLGDLSCKVFFQRLWVKLESVHDPGVVKPSPHQYHPVPYLYDQAPYELQAVAHEGFLYLLNTGYVYPKLTGDYTNFSRSERYCWTERGLQWVKGAEPIPEEAAGYMKFLRAHVPTLDEVIAQYISEAVALVPLCTRHDRETEGVVRCQSGGSLGEAMKNEIGAKPNAAWTKRGDRRDVP